MRQTIWDRIKEWWWRITDEYPVYERPGSLDAPWMEEPDPPETHPE